MRNKLKQIFKTINYVPFPECNIEANLATQFTEHALNQIVDALIANGVIISPIKAGQTCYREERWAKNLDHLMSGGFGDTTKPETLLNYWMAQERAGYPYASENVKYFEEMVGIERCKIGMSK